MREILLVIAIVLFILAAFQLNPRTPGGVAGRIHLGWLGLAFFALATRF